MSRVLVTGGTGYVGTVLVPKLVQTGYEVRTFDSQHFGDALGATAGVESIRGDIRDKSAIKKALDGCDTVIHLAGIVTDELVDMNKRLAFEVNTKATVQLATLIKQASRDIRFLYASSSSVYGSTSKAATERDICLPSSYYARTKYWAELPVAEAGGTVVRCATCFGPAPRMRLDTIVNVFCKQAYFDGKIMVHDGTQWRSNVHVTDAADFYIFLLQQDQALIQSQTFNLVQHSYPALEIAEEVSRTYFGDTSHIDVDRTKLDPRHYRISGWKAASILHWAPEHTIAHGVRDNIAWFEAGKIQDPEADIWYNNRRMAEVVKRGG